MSQIDSGEAHGHIVAGCPDTGLAYIVPASEVFADIEGIFTGERTDRYPSELTSENFPLQNAVSLRQHTLAQRIGHN